MRRLAVLPFLTACLGEPTATPASCASCHGDSTSFAPPEGLGGVTDTSTVGVGAHRAHVEGPQGFAVACNECHVVPSAVDDEGHMNDGTWFAEVVWNGELANLDDAAQPWDHASATCTVYCHGATLTGGLHTAPVWTQVDGAQVGCDGCHGAPPPPPHPSNPSCENCHVGVAGAGMTILDPAKHFDGIITAIGATVDCGECHGTADNPAPPPDLAGNTDTTLVTVGAHATHTDPGGLSAAVPCSACHHVPTSLDDPQHMDGGSAELTFGNAATANGMTPTWNEANATCTNTWCHSVGGNGGTNEIPTWTAVGSGEASCGSCHGLPPPSPHPQNTSCQNCHGSVAGPDFTIVDPVKHVDGLIEF